MRRIAVIGAGVTGCSVAWHLQSRALDEIHLFDRDLPGSGTTWHSAGLVVWNPEGDYDAPVLYLLELIERLERQTGLRSGWRETGRLYLARDGAEMDGFSDFHALSRERGVDVRLLSPQEAAKYHPLLSPAALHGACFNPKSGHLDPAGLLELFLRSAKSLGVIVHQRTPVSELVVKSGQIRGIVTGDGTRYPFDDVVICAGLWSAELLGQLDIVLAQGGCEHMYVILDPPERLPSNTPAFLSSADLIYGREEVGGLLLGCFDTDAKVVDVDRLPDPFAFTLLNDDWDKFLPYYEAAAEFFPALNDAAIRRFINGPEAFTPDGDPLVGAVSGTAGLWLCTAMNSHGVTISGAAGHIVADLLAGAEPRFPIDAYLPDRFGERVRDPAWLRQKISDSPSGNY